MEQRPALRRRFECPGNDPIEPGELRIVLSVATLPAINQFAGWIDPKSLAVDDAVPISLRLLAEGELVANHRLHVVGHQPLREHF